MVTGPGQDVHAQCRRISELDEEDLLTADLLHRPGFPSAGEDVEGVQAGAHLWVISQVHDVLGMLKIINKPAPGQCLIGDPDTVMRSQVAGATQLLSKQFIIIGGGGGDIGTQQDGVDPQPVHQVELRLHAVQILEELLLPHPLKIPEGLEEIQGQAQVYGTLTDLFRGVRGDDEILFKDLNPIKTRIGGGAEFLREGSG